MNTLKTTVNALSTAKQSRPNLPAKRYKLRQQFGVSLIELMVAMVIGLVVSLAIYGVLNVNEGRKRSTTSTNDIDQSGAYTIYQFSKLLRSAGSGFSATSSTLLSGAGSAFGCALQAKFNNASVLLPAGGALPEPFAGVTQALRLAPVIIFPDAAVSGAGLGTKGDVLAVMAGSGGLGESITDFSAKPTASTLTLTSLAGFRANDLVLVTDNTVGGNCLVEQVSSTFTPTSTSLSLPLAGTYYTSGVGTTTLVNFSATFVTSSVLNLGQMPLFNLFGVGANNTLFSYDLLRPANNTVNSADANPSAFAENVYAMYAIYGISNATTPLTWTLPTGDYAPASLLAGTAAANGFLQNIKAVKVVIIMQAALPEKIPAGQATIQSPGVTFTGSGADASGTVNLFANELATPVVQTVNKGDRRYRLFEVTIPIRNSLMIP